MLPVPPAGQVDLGPVVESCPLQVPVIKGKAQRLHQVEACRGCGAETGDISRIWRDFRLDQDNLEGARSIHR